MTQMMDDGDERTTRHNAIVARMAELIAEMGRLVAERDAIVDGLARDAYRRFGLSAQLALLNELGDDKFSRDLAALLVANGLRKVLATPEIAALPGEAADHAATFLSRWSSWIAKAVPAAADAA